VSKVPHPVPYQGSKRLLARAILAHAPRQAHTLYEPFAGSLALSLAAAAEGRADRFVVGDALSPLAALWDGIVTRPAEISAAYDRLWSTVGPPDPYGEIRDAFNEDGDPAKLLYLLARCVKGAVRFNARGAFNQAPDRRRRGVAPARMARHVDGASRLLGGRTRVVAGDFELTLATAGPEDLAYLDPPWQGTSTGKNRRYASGLARERLVAALVDLQRRRVPFLLSYDGKTGDRRYGEPLPPSLDLRLVELDGGRSTQATLLGRSARTTESLYVWPLRR
jgi:DNA adenine methylase